MMNENKQGKIPEKLGAGYVCFVQYSVVMFVIYATAAGIRVTTSACKVWKT